MSYFPDGYLKYSNNAGDKVYRAVLRSPGHHTRISRRCLLTAWFAISYGARLAKRHERLFAAQPVVKETS